MFDARQLRLWSGRFAVVLLYLTEYCFHVGSRNRFGVDVHVGTWRMLAAFVVDHCRTCHLTATGLRFILPMDDHGADSGQGDAILGGGHTTGAAVAGTSNARLKNTRLRNTRHAHKPHWAATKPLL